MTRKRSSRKIFYMGEIERAVLSGLQKHLKTPRLLREFAQAYQEERQRLAGENRRRHGQIESQLAQLARAIDRLWADYESERVPVDIAWPKLKEMQAQRIALEAELTEQPPEEQIVGLHPAALQRYEMHVSELQRVFGAGVTPHTEEAAQKIRNLIARVTITPRWDEGFSLELQGRLALLMGARGLYPNMRVAASGGSLVAEVRYRRSPRPDFPRFTLALTA